MESQTPREILSFSAALRLPSSVSSSQRAKLVAELIRLLHLERAADTIVGDPSRGGLSGGERKRTNVGGELVTNPSVVFLDEPTSGLDAFTSFKVMAMLKDLALHGRTVICTIHQPASGVFASFDNLALMHKGGCGKLTRVKLCLAIRSSSTSCLIPARSLLWSGVSIGSVLCHPWPCMPKQLQPSRLRRRSPHAPAA